MVLKWWHDFGITGRELRNGAQKIRTSQIKAEKTKTDSKPVPLRRNAIRAREIMCDLG